MTAHQGQFLGQGNQLYSEGAHIWLLDYDATTRLKHPPEFIRRLLLVANVTEGVHHDDACEGFVWEGEAFRI